MATCMSAVPTANSPTLSTGRVIRGSNASVEALPFTRFPRLGIVIDGGGYYRRGTEKVTQYLILAGPRISLNYGKWRPFIQAFGGIRHVNSVGFIYNPIAVDVGGGADYKLRFKSFSWRFQGDYIYSHYRQRLRRTITGPPLEFGLALLRLAGTRISPSTNSAAIRISLLHVQNFVASTRVHGCQKREIFHA